LPRAASRDLRIGEMETQLGRANRDDREILVSNGYGQLEHGRIPQSRGAYGWHEHQDVVNRPDQGGRRKLTLGSCRRQSAWTAGQVSGV
jgi:hypothetical protein